ncbi:MAG TPA: hypothetical protein VIW23_03750 [Candidatus Acidoferrum sp.]|jgi:hypothetical protein
MTTNLTRYLNKTILVSIPALFDDGVCRPYKLLGADFQGVWLQSEKLTDRLLPDEASHFRDFAPAVFVPFAQIAGVLVGTGAPAAPQTAKSSGDLGGRTEGDAQTARGPTKRSAKKR